jgi:hypothetical protein
MLKREIVIIYKYFYNYILTHNLINFKNKTSSSKLSLRPLIIIKCKPNRLENINRCVISKFFINKSNNI